MLLSTEQAREMLTSRTCGNCKHTVTKTYCRDDDEFAEVGHAATCSDVFHNDHLKHNIQRIGDDPEVLRITPRVFHKGSYNAVRDVELQAHRGEPKFPPNPNCRLCGGKGERITEDDECIYCMCRYEDELPEWALKKSDAHA